jgi:acetyl-CoA synthetase
MSEAELDVLLKTEETFPPPPEFAEQANANDPKVYEEADADPEAWWASWADKLEWIEPYEQVLDWSDPPWAKWFAGGKLNASVNCLDRHVDAGNGDRVALHWEGEDASRREVSYAELLEETQRFANVLKGLGIGKGDVVGIYLPMLPETVAAMLACARIGAIHNVVFGGFSAESVKERMQFSDAKALVTADATMRRGKPTPMKEAVDGVAGEIDTLEHIVVVNRGDTDPPMTDGRDVFWHEAVAEADAECEPEPMDSEDPLYILYTSGSTGKPKGILPDPGLGHPQAGLRPEGLGRLLVRRRRRLGHRPQLHRLRPHGQRRDQRHVRGGAQLPRRGPLVGDRRALQGLHLLHGADRHPRLHEVGPRAPGQT